MCPSQDSCKNAQDLFASLQLTLTFPLLKARCSPRSVDWSLPLQPKFVATLVPDRSSNLSKRHLASAAAQTSYDAPSKRKKLALRQSVKRNTTDLYNQFRQDHKR
jgi:hypothetical protein